MVISCWWQMSLIWPAIGPSPECRASEMLNEASARTGALTTHCSLLCPCIVNYYTRSQTFEQKRECLQSNRRTTGHHAHTHRLQVSFSCNFRMIFLIKPVWSWFACLFSLTLQLEIIQTKLLPRAMLIQLSDIHMFRTLTRRFLATLLKENKVFPNYIVCYEHQNWFSIPCGEVPRWSQSS